jgi:predicted metal-dependent hydrolase
LLAYTAAMEHLTAVIGHAILATPSFRDKMHPHVRPLWIWHSIEEIEHKAVAHEVLEVVGGNRAQRVIVMLLTLLGLFNGVAIGLLLLLLADKQLFNFKAFVGFFRMLVDTGVASCVARGVADYFRRDFHPWQVDDRALLAEGLLLLDEAGSGIAA